MHEPLPTVPDFPRCVFRVCVAAAETPCRALSSTPNDIGCFTTYKSRAGCCGVTGGPTLSWAVLGSLVRCPWATCWGLRGGGRLSSSCCTLGPQVLEGVWIQASHGVLQSPAPDLVLSVCLFGAAGPCLFCKPRLGSCGLRRLYESLQVGWLVEISEIL